MFDISLGSRQSYYSVFDLASMNKIDDISLIVHTLWDHPLM